MKFFTIIKTIITAKHRKTPSRGFMNFSSCSFKILSCFFVGAFFLLIHQESFAQGEDHSEKTGFMSVIRKRRQETASLTQKEQVKEKSQTESLLAATPEETKKKEPALARVESDVQVKPLKRKNRRALKIRESTVHGNEPLSPSDEAKMIDDKEATDDFFTRNWRGWRTKLADAGFQLELNYKAETQTVIRGGRRPRKTAFLGLLALKSTINTEQLMKLKGGTFFFFLQGIHGRRPSFSVGDA